MRRKIRCDREFCKVLKFWRQLNRANSFTVSLTLNGQNMIFAASIYVQPWKQWEYFLLLTTSWAGAIAMFQCYQTEFSEQLIHGEFGFSYVTLSNQHAYSYRMGHVSKKKNDKSSNLMHSVFLRSSSLCLTSASVFYRFIFCHRLELCTSSAIIWAVSCSTATVEQMCFTSSTTCAQHSWT